MMECLMSAKSLWFMQLACIVHVLYAWGLNDMHWALVDRAVFVESWEGTDECHKGMLRGAVLAAASTSPSMTIAQCC